jgi:hypothetical protein
MSPCSSLLAGQAQLDAIISPMIINRPFDMYVIYNYYICNNEIVSAVAFINKG